MTEEDEAADGVRCGGDPDGGVGGGKMGFEEVGERPCHETDGMGIFGGKRDEDGLFECFFSSGKHGAGDVFGESVDGADNGDFGKDFVGGVEEGVEEKEAGEIAENDDE